MNDTPRHIEEKMRQMIMEKTPAERMQMGFSMFDFSREIVLSSIRAEHPNASPETIRGHLFLRFYGNDFPPAQRKNILRRLQKK